MPVDHRPAVETPPNEQQPATPPKHRLELSMPQIVAGALAAASAAFASSWLGVAGTVLGAVVVSIVASVGTALYSHSLQRSSQVLRELPLAQRSLRSRPHVADATTIFAPQFERARRIRWGAVAVSAVVILVAGVAILTGVEALLGRSAASLTGRDNHATTLGELVGSGPQRPTHQPAHHNPTPAGHQPGQPGPTQSTVTATVTQPATPLATSTHTTAPTSPTPTTPTSPATTSAPTTTAPTTTAPTQGGSTTRP